MRVGSKQHKNNSVKSERGNKNFRSAYVPIVVMGCQNLSDERRNDRVKIKS